MFGIRLLPACDHLSRARLHGWFSRERRHQLSGRALVEQSLHADHQRACRDQEEGKLPTDRSKWTVDRAADEWMQRRLVEGRAENTIRTDRERLQMIRRYFGTRRIVEPSATRVLFSASTLRITLEENHANDADCLEPCSRSWSYRLSKRGGTSGCSRSDPTSRDGCLKR